jgi:hypothetical protein
MESLSFVRIRCNPVSNEAVLSAGRRIQDGFRGYLVSLQVKLVTYHQLCSLNTDDIADTLESLGWFP